MGQENDLLMQGGHNFLQHFRINLQKFEQVTSPSLEGSSLYTPGPTSGL